MLSPFELNQKENKDQFVDVVIEGTTELGDIHEAQGVLFRVAETGKLGQKPVNRRKSSVHPGEH